EQHFRIADEGVDGGAAGPAALVLQRLGQIPVVDRDIRLHAAFQQLVDELVIVRDAFRVDGAVPVGNDARPGDGEPVRLRAEVFDQFDVFFVPVVAVAGHVAVVPVSDVARRVAEGVPDGQAAPVFIVRALDLVRRGGGAPDESLRKLDDGHDAVPPCCLLPGGVPVSSFCTKAFRCACGSANVSPSAQHDFHVVDAAVAGDGNDLAFHRLAVHGDGGDPFADAVRVFHPDAVRVAAELARHGVGFP